MCESNCWCVGKGPRRENETDRHRVQEKQGARLSAVLTQCTNTQPPTVCPLFRLQLASLSHVRALVPARSCTIADLLATLLTLVAFLERRSTDTSRIGQRSSVPVRGRARNAARQMSKRQQHSTDWRLP